MSPIHLDPDTRRRKLTVRFEVLTAVVMSSSIFWDITPYSPLNVNWRFGRTFRLHLQNRKIKLARNQCESRWQALAPAFTFDLARLIFRSWRWKRNVPPKRQLTINGLHGVISQKIVLLVEPYLCSRICFHIYGRRFVLLKMQAEISSGKLVTIYHSTRRHFPEHSILRSRRLENLKSHLLYAPPFSPFILS
jgi:hypothetical protein